MENNLCKSCEINYGFRKNIAVRELSFVSNLNDIQRGRAEENLQKVKCF